MQEHAEPENQNVDTGEQTEQFVVFRLGDEEYAAPILDIQEIIPAGDITPFPNAPQYVEGIINVRGTVATVVSLARLFNLPTKPEGSEGYIILVKTEKNLFGVQVDSVSSVMNFNPSNIRSAEGVAEVKIDAAYVHGVAVVDDRVILVLNLQQVLHEDAMPEPTEAPAEQSQTAEAAAPAAEASPSQSTEAAAPAA